MRKILSPFILLVMLLTGCGGSTPRGKDSDKNYDDIDQDTSGAPEIAWDTKQDSLRTGIKNIDFYNVNDTHGCIEENGEEPGISKISSYLKERRNQNPEGFVFTSSGDMWQGSADSNITRGKLIIDWMDYEGCSAMALGNHEFDWTIDVLKNNLAYAKHDFLACNIVDSSSKTPVDWVKPYTTITRNGVHIGIIGAIGEGITGSILATNVKGLTFDRPDSYVVKWSKYLRDNGADVVLFLYHYSTQETSYDLGKYVDGIFGGHNHALETSSFANGVRGYEGLSNGRAVSHIGIKYNFDSKSYSYGACGNAQIYGSYFDKNPDVETIKAKYADEINHVKNEQVAKIDRYLDSYNDIPLLYDRYAYRYYQDIGGDKPITFIVTNNARNPLSPGIVTYGDIYKALPFDNQLTLCRCKGRDIIEGITNYSSSRWYFPGVGEYLIDRSDVYNYLALETYYYFLAIDYVSTYEGYTSWMNIEHYYAEESSLPRNIMKTYLAQEYPL